MFCGLNLDIICVSFGHLAFCEVQLLWLIDIRCSPWLSYPPARENEAFFGCIQRCPLFCILLSILCYSLSSLSLCRTENVLAVTFYVLSSSSAAHSLPPIWPLNSPWVNFTNWKAILCQQCLCSATKDEFLIGNWAVSELGQTSLCLLLSCTTLNLLCCSLSSKETDGERDSKV